MNADRATQATNVCALLLIGTFASCQQVPPQDTRELAKRLDAVEKTAQAAQRRVESVERQLEAIETNRVATVSTIDPSYALLAPNTAPFLFSVEKAEPYLDGFKITAKIGNTTAADFLGIDLTVSWLASGDSPWRSEDFSIATRLKRASWTPISFILSPAKAEDIRTLYVKAETNNVSLNGR